MDFQVTLSPRSLVRSYLSHEPADFDFVLARGKGNMERILESISVARARGATVRVGPELEIPGYGCLDHFLEGGPLFFLMECVVSFVLVLA
jgi:hypothetical protein